VLTDPEEIVEHNARRRKREAETRDEKAAKQARELSVGVQPKRAEGSGDSVLGRRNGRSTVGFG